MTTDDRKLVKLVPKENLTPVQEFLAKKHFDAWELKNRTKINEAVERLLDSLINGRK